MKLKGHENLHDDLFIVTEKIHSIKCARVRVLPDPYFPVRFCSYTVKRGSEKAFILAYFTR